MAQELQGHTDAAREAEKRERIEQAGLPLKEKVFSYDLRPSSLKALSAMKIDKTWQALDPIWKREKYCYPDRVGKQFELLREARPSTRHEYQEIMFEEYPYASFMALAHTIAAKSFILPKHFNNGKPQFITPQFALDGLFIRVPINSWSGYEGEVMGLELLQQRITKGENKNYDSVRYATTDEDTSDAIDLVLMLAGVPTFGLQVKPASYFYFDDPYSTRGKEKVSNLAANRAWEKANNATVYYLNTADIRNGQLNPQPLKYLEELFRL